MTSDAFRARRSVLYMPSSIERALEKALYELRYEMDNRPEWVRIPLQGILALVNLPSAPTVSSTGVA